MNVKLEVVNVNVNVNVIVIVIVIVKMKERTSENIKKKEMNFLYFHLFYIFISQIG